MMPLVLLRPFGMVSLLGLVWKFFNVLSLVMGLCMSFIQGFPSDFQTNKSRVNPEVGDTVRFSLFIKGDMEIEA